MSDFVKPRADWLTLDAAVFFFPFLDRGIYSDGQSNCTGGYPVRRRSRSLRDSLTR